VLSLLIPPHHGGALRAIVTTREAGMRWTQRLAARLVRADERDNAYGEIVWSWPPGAEAVRNAFHAFRRGQSSRSPRRARISVKTIAQGMPGCSAGPVVTAACFLCCRRAMGAASARHSLCPLLIRGYISSITRARRVAGMRGYVWISRSTNPLSFRGVRSTSPESILTGRCCSNEME
jgi:hypothetical protein